MKKYFKSNKNRKKRWSAQEKAFLKNNAGSITDQEIANKLGKSLKAIRDMRQRLGIIKKSGRGICELTDE